MVCKMPYVDIPGMGRRTALRDGRRMETNVHTEYTDDTDVKAQYYLSMMTLVQFRSDITKLFPMKTVAKGSFTTATIDLVKYRRVIYMDSSGALLVCLDSDLVAMEASADVFYPIYRQTTQGWIRWQPVTVAVVLCFDPSTATIARVAGLSTTSAGGTDTTFGNVDGALGTNRLAGPTAIAYNPVDKCIYFIDGGTSTFVKKYDPVTEAVSTTTVNSQTVNSLRASGGFAIDKFGEFYFLCQDTSDNNNPFLTRVSADGATETIIWRTDTVTPSNNIYGCTDMAISPDGVYIYFGGAKQGYGSGATIPSAYHMVRTLTHPSGTPLGTLFAGDDTTSTLQFGGTNVNTQGEGVAATSGRIDGAFCYFCDKDGNIFSWSEDTLMIRKTLPDGSSIVSISNHIPLDSHGDPQFGATAGNGLPAFTLNDNTPQFGNARGMAIDACENIILGDGFVRYIDSNGILNMAAGSLTDFDPTHWPTTTPSPALTTVIPFGMQRLCYSQEENAAYFTAAYFDGADNAINAIYRVGGI